MRVVGLLRKQVRRGSVLSIIFSRRVSALSTMAANPTSKIAAIAQQTSTANKIKNLCDVAQCAHWAVAKNASMLFLPECFGFIGVDSSETLRCAESPLGETADTADDEFCDVLRDVVKTGILPSNLQDDSDSFTSLQQSVRLLDGLRSIATESGLWISAGGMHILGAPPDPESGRERVYNTHLILDDQGEVRAVYRKIHLFDVSIPGKVQLRESASTAPGTDVVVCDSPLGKLGLSTCYDVRFPEQYMRLTEMGAEILLVPSAFTVPTGEAHWHTLLQCRAIESQCYVLAAAQVGRHNEKRESFGHSLAVDPWGTIVADAGGTLDHTSNAAPSIVTCEIDTDLIYSIRERMPLQSHRAVASLTLVDD